MYQKFGSISTLLATSRTRIFKYSKSGNISQKDFFLSLLTNGASLGVITKTLKYMVLLGI